MTGRPPYTFDEISVSFVSKAATYAGRRYRRWEVEREDFAQEIFVWLYTPANTARVNQWLDREPQRLTRIYRSLLDVAIRYGEKEKAAHCGYAPDDILWWTPAMVEATLPLALDATFDGITSAAPEDNDGGKHNKPPDEGGNLLASVVDVRQALALSPRWVREVLDHGEVLNRDNAWNSANAYPGWDDAVLHLVNQLGGSRLPVVGRRRVITNATAQHRTHAQGAS
jgi:hypothetical protein